MVESSNKKVRFPAGKQRDFLEKVQQKLDVTLKDLGKVAGVHVRTITDWRREKFLMDLTAAQKFSRKSEISLPSNFEVLNRFWYAAKGARKGGEARYKKYGQVGGDSAARMEKWQEWWSTKGKFETANASFQRKSVRKPRKSTELAEFLGIMLGDGGITSYQASITLHDRDDLQYSVFVTDLVEHLFGVRPSVYHRPKSSVNTIVVSRRDLVDFLCIHGLPIGNKVRQQCDIPGWIKSNKKFSIACVRGLVDTDGSIFTHRYVVNGKQYSYKKLGFTSRSAPLQRSVAHILERAGIFPRISGYDVRVDSIADMDRYFKIIGTHNPKHLKRYQM